MPMNNDTIAAIATPPGSGGIAILRLSGPEVLKCLEKLFVPTVDNFSFIPRHMHYGHILDDAGEVLDEVLAVHMPGPRSATGEDVGEIHCHGGPAIASTLLEAILGQECRLAEAGEFTKRAFLNGRIDLTQAEAVAELIAAPSREGIRLAEAKMSGALGREVETLLKAVDELRVHLVAAMDFSEDIEMMPRDIIRDKCEDILTPLKKLLESYKRARLWREGAGVVLAGQVNAGKSSLLNAFLGRDRALVSPVPGTTRDYIEESVLIKGLALRLIDTAGLRESGDIVEKEGIRLSHKLSERADLILLVVDSSKGLASADMEFLEKYQSFVDKGRLLVVMNKSDLPHATQNFETHYVHKTLGTLSQNSKTDLTYPLVDVSASTGEGMEELSDKMVASLVGSQELASSDIAPNLRQSNLLKKAEGELKELLKELDAGLPEDILSIRLDFVATALQEVTGKSSSDDILGQIFSGFCVGK